MRKIQHSSGILIHSYIFLVNMKISEVIYISLANHSVPSVPTRLASIMSFNFCSYELMKRIFRFLLLKIVSDFFSVEEKKEID